MNFKKLLENLKNPKTKSITMLVVYGIFFIFVFIFLNAKEPPLPQVNQPKEEFQDNYRYTITINNNEEKEQVTGTYENNKDTFIYNEKTYIKENGIVYLNGQTVNIDFNIDKYKYGTVNLLIDSSDSLTTYKDILLEVYKIKANKYFNIVNELNDCNTIDCSNIDIEITIEKDEYIKHATIDLSNYYNYPYTIDIKYDQIKNN